MINSRKKDFFYILIMLTVVLLPALVICRGQGLGQLLVTELLSCAGSNDIYLITVTKRAAFYQRCGFQVVDDASSEAAAAAAAVPRALRLERLIGSPIAWAAAKDTLVVMRYKGT